MTFVEKPQLKIISCKLAGQLKEIKDFPITVVNLISHSTNRGLL